MTVCNKQVASVLEKICEKLDAKITRRIEQLETEIEEADAKLAELADLMQTTNEASELMTLQKEVEECTEKQEAAMLEWEELSEQVF